MHLVSHLNCFDMIFELFDPDQPLDITHRELPHWYQPGVTYFVTFRTIDSMPREVLDVWYTQRDEWLRDHSIEPIDDEWGLSFRKLPIAEQAEFHKLFSHAYHQALDKGQGECVLRQPKLARIVADSLLHFSGDRYYMGDFVIMPNHVHLLVCLCGTTALTTQCKSWKKFTASQIHKVLNKHGHFWQAESFDHLVRSPEQFAYFQQYVADNPRKANLRDGEYLLYHPLK
jgi:putative transposase